MCQCGVVWWALCAPKWFLVSSGVNSHFNSEAISCRHLLVCVDITYVVCTLFVCGVYTVCLWCVHCLYVVCTLFVRGVLTVCTWCVHCLFMVCITCVQGWPEPCIYTVYTRYFGRKITNYTVLYGVYIYSSGQPYVCAVCIRAIWSCCVRVRLPHGL
jgi:hypothetical protein